MFALQETSRAALLLARKIGGDIGIGAQSILLHNTNDSDDRYRLLWIEPDVLSDCVTVGPEASRKLIVDDRYPLRARSIVFIEEPSQFQRDLKSAEVIARGGA
jgi:hypothetical protein